MLSKYFFSKILLAKEFKAHPPAYTKFFENFLLVHFKRIKSSKSSKTFCIDEAISCLNVFLFSSFLKSE